MNLKTTKMAEPGYELARNALEQAQAQGSAGEPLSGDALIGATHCDTRSSPNIFRDAYLKGKQKTHGRIPP
jgi:hypothetical protein